MHPIHAHLAALVVLAFLVMLAVLVVITVLWVLPITLGVWMARRKNYSPLWMLFGIHPLGGWIAFIVLACLPARVQCGNCGGFVPAYFRLCQYCQAEMKRQGQDPQIRG